MLAVHGSAIAGMPPAAAPSRTPQSNVVPNLKPIAVIYFNDGTPILEEHAQMVRNMIAESRDDFKITVQEHALTHEDELPARIEQIADTEIGMIVIVEPPGYQHFAGPRGVRDARVYLADPSPGNIRKPAYTVPEHWQQPHRNGLHLVVEPNAGLPDKTALTLPQNLPPRMDIMTAREMLAVGNALRLPEILR